MPLPDSKRIGFGQHQPLCASGVTMASASGVRYPGQAGQLALRQGVWPGSNRCFKAGRTFVRVPVLST